MLCSVIFSDDVDRRIRIFEDTMDQCHDNPQLSASIQNTIANTKLYKPNFPMKGTSGDPQQCAVAVTKERTFACAERLHKEHPTSRIAVLNFASATNPGGGVQRGSNAQEECLCRCSTLFSCIRNDAFFGRFYGMHRKRKDLRYTDTCIYSPGITVFKSDIAFPEMKPESEWFSVDVITCAAPNLRKRPYNKMNPGSANPIQVHKEELLEIHKKRGRQSSVLPLPITQIFLCWVHSAAVRFRMIRELSHRHTRKSCRSFRGISRRFALQYIVRLGIQEITAFLSSCLENEKPHPKFARHFWCILLLVAESS